MKNFVGVPGFALCHSSIVTSSSPQSTGAEVHILRIEHPVPDYDAWKEAFDSDPISRG